MLETTTTHLLEESACVTILARDVLRRVMVHTTAWTLQEEAPRTVLAHLNLGRHDFVDGISQ
jgi:hypothetical protein